MSAAYPLVRNLSACSTRRGVRTSPSRLGSSPTATRSWRMRSSTHVLYILLFFASGVLLYAQSDPDALYRDRATAGKAEAAAALWQQQLDANPADVDAAWKLARAMYWIGTRGPQAGRRSALERGVAAARQAAT